MAQLYPSAAKCPGSGLEPMEIKVKRGERRDDGERNIHVGWCDSCRYWIGLDVRDCIRPHMKWPHHASAAARLVDSGSAETDPETGSNSGTAGAQKISKLQKL